MNTLVLPARLPLSEAQIYYRLAITVGWSLNLSEPQLPHREKRSHCIYIQESENKKYMYVKILY